MIKLEQTQIEGWEPAIRGMRNPMNSWEKSDSRYCSKHLIGAHACKGCPSFNEEGSYCEPAQYIIGPNDYELMMKLRNAGTDHRKFMRMLVVYLDITAPLYWWKEFDTYKVGTVANSCSTMHKIHEKEFSLDDFSHDKLVDVFYYPNGGLDSQEKRVSALCVLKEVIDTLNAYRNLYVNWDKQEDFIQHAFDYDKKLVWWQMIQLLPTSYNQKRTVMLNYEVLANMYRARKNHKLDEWREFCKWIEGLPYSELITGESAGESDA